MQIYRFKYPVYFLVLLAAMLLTGLDIARVAWWSNTVNQPAQWWFWLSVKGVLYGCWTVWLLVLWYAYIRYGYQRHTQTALSWRYLLAVLMLVVVLPAVMGLVYFAWQVPGSREVSLLQLYQDVWLHYGYPSLIVGAGIAVMFWVLPGFYPAENAPSKQPDGLTVNQRAQLIPVAISELDWVQADGNYVLLHTHQAVHPLRENISRLADFLAPKGFLRVHRSALVNRDSVQKLYRIAGQWRVAMASGASAPVSRRRVQDIKAQLAGLTVHNRPSTSHPNILAGSDKSP